MYWIAGHVFRPDDLSEPGHEYNVHVLEHWVRAKPGSSLHLALTALSHAVFGRAKNVPKAIAEGERAYVSALNRTKLAVSRQEEESTDSLLLTTMLMGFYEVPPRTPSC